MRINTPEEDTITVTVSWGDHNVLLVDLWTGIGLILTFVPLSYVAPNIWFRICAGLVVIAGFYLFARALPLLFTVQTWTFRRDTRVLNYSRWIAWRAFDDLDLSFDCIIVSTRLDLRGKSLVLRPLPFQARRCPVSFVDRSSPEFGKTRTINILDSKRKALDLAARISDFTGAENLAE